MISFKKSMSERRYKKSTTTSAMYPKRKVGRSQYTSGFLSSKKQFPSSQNMWSQAPRTYGGKAKNTTITVRHIVTSQNGTSIMPTSTPTGNSQNVISNNLQNQQLARELYKKCLDQKASSRSILTSAQRASLLQACMQEVQLGGQQASQTQVPALTSGSLNSVSPTMTKEELVKVLLSKLSISESASTGISSQQQVSPSP